MAELKFVPTNKQTNKIFSSSADITVKCILQMDNVFISTGFHARLSLRFASV